MERLDRLSVRVTGLVLTAVVAGLLFTPVFGLTPLLLPVAVPALSVLAATLLCTLPAGARERLVDWRPLLTSLAGLLAVIWAVLPSTTAAGLPTGRTLAALASGVARSWRLVLQSTWPVRPEGELLVLVALLVTMSAVLGVEILLRLRAPLAALLPGLAVVVLSQAYAALPLAPAVLAAAGYAVAAALVLAGPVLAGPELAGPLGLLRAAVSGGVLLLVSGLSLVVLPDNPARWSLRAGQDVPLGESLPVNPLDEIAYRMQHPATEVFRVSTTSAVDRWPLLVMDDFDGVTWRTDGRYRQLGAELRPGPEVTVPADRVHADITSAGTGGPWLPSQTWPAAVTGIAPRVAPRYGTLALPGSGGVASYRLDWWQPRVDESVLGGAAVDADVAAAAAPIPGVPDGVQELAGRATQEMRPSFRTALLLENYLRTHYRRADGGELPTGHSWPQLQTFLFDTRRGTSEQFAAAYVVLARTQSIPARLAVGFRAPVPAPGDPVTVVTNADVLAWPEVAVEGVGWVPLDPYGKATGGPAAGGTGLAARTEAARQQLPPLETLREPATTVRPGDGSPGGAAEPFRTPWTMLLAVPLVPLLAWPVGVPAVWALRSRWRRRRGGRAAVAGAGEEVRDRLRAYGLPVTPGMTLRDLGAAAGHPVGEELRAMAVVTDRALWSGTEPPGRDVTQVWDRVAAVRRALARRGWRARIRALLDPRPLLPGRSVGALPGRSVSSRRPRRGSASAR